MDYEVDMAEKVSAWRGHGVSFRVWLLYEVFSDSVQLSRLEHSFRFCFHSLLSDTSDMTLIYVDTLLHETL